MFRFLNGIMRFFASLRLAVALMSLLIAVIAGATFLEKSYGASAVQFTVYQTGWFFAINALLGLNVLASVLIRFPWKRRHVGFLMTHVGILLLLTGCWLSWLGGVEAQLPVVEGREAHRAYQNAKPLPSEMASEDSPTFDLGFSVYLREFQMRLEPGSAMPANYASLVDFVSRDSVSHEGEKKILRENVLISMNAPVDFADPQTGRVWRLFQSGYNGPWKPGTPEFEFYAGKDRSREQLFLSILKVSHDPGRVWKYAGSLLIVLGIVVVFYLRKIFQPRSSPIVQHD
jgi:cytochrome c biogenesis protein ResB